MNNPGWLTALGFYTLIIIGGIYYYEDKITKLKQELDVLDSDYDAAHANALSITTANLDQENSLLQKQVKDLKLENAELKATAGDWQRAYNLSQPIQYESSSYWNQADIDYSKLRRKGMSFVVVEDKAPVYKDVDTVIEL
jgi:FtsZ-binding cell division protein ZapB